MPRFPLIPLALSVTLGLAAAASAAPSPDTTPEGLAAFAGVWAPEPRPPEPQGGRAGPGSDRQHPERNRPDRRRPGDAADGGALRLGGPQPRSGGRMDSDPRFTVSETDAAKGLEAADMRIRAQMTPAGRARFDQFDPTELPSANCQSAGLPGIAVIPQLQEWSADGEMLVIRHESYGAVRTIDTRPGATTGVATHTVLGTATGRIDGDTMVIETTNLKAGWGGLGRNAPGSDQRTVTETYRLIDADTIEGVIELRDPLYLTRVLRIPVTLKRQPAGTEIVDFPCEVEVARRHLTSD